MEERDGLDNNIENNVPHYKSAESLIQKERINERDLLEKRKEKLIYFMKNKQAWIIIVLLIAVILGIYIRSQPMTDHNGKPGLWDITTNTWTLGPDLDPWLFYRNAKTIIEQGSLPEKDMMRNVPLGFDNTKESQLLSYMIAWTYKILNIFTDVNIELASVLFPVIMFAFTIISFFLFVREVFIRNSKKSIIKANLIASISTFFMIVIPVFLSRTVAGIPEKESAAFFFMFLTFYFFLKAWRCEKIKSALILGILAGISTSLMGLIWGGVIYIFIPIAIAVLIAFILNKVHKKGFTIYTSWILISILLLILLSGRYSIQGILTSISTGSAFIVLLIMVTHYLLWNTKLSKAKILNKSNIPKTIISLIVSVIILSIIILIFFGPVFAFDKLKAIHQTFFQPITGRWNITVAENKQPYFVEWVSNFGPYIKKIPILFWLFFIGSVVLFRKMLNPIRKKDAWILTGFYVLFFIGLVFSRYAPHPNLFDGDNFISKLLYYGTAIALIFCIGYYYTKYFQKGDKRFEKIRFEYLILFSLFMTALLTARGAVRLIMVLGPIAPIFVGFLIIESIDKFRRVKDGTWRIIFGVFILLILGLSIFTFVNFYKTTKTQAYYFIPSSYNTQWQKAMQWVREETPEDAVFAHWWDYGYWLQSIGNRATVTDGGNAIAYWNYLMGRVVLTGDNQNGALEFLYNHNATHLLIDSSDIGKYTAYSSIGSNEDFDRYSWIGTFLLDEKQTQETNNETIKVYTGGVALDEDLVIEENNREILLPVGSAGVGALLLPLKESEGNIKFLQPQIIIIYQGIQHRVNLRYLSIQGEFFDFGSGIEATAFIFSRLEESKQGISQNPLGAAMFISPRLMRGMMSQIYILDDPLGNFPNFKLTHSEQSLLVEDLKNQGMPLKDFVFYNGIHGPIKIWEIKYTGKEQVKEEYIDTDYTKYIDWRL